METLTISPIEKIRQTHTLTNQQMLAITRPDKQILSSMDEDTYEELVASWAYSCLKPLYEDAYRIGGAGDSGIDIIAYTSLKNKECEIYQCKHYQNALTATVVIPEICKILYHAFLGTIPIPRKYYIVAPKGLSSSMLKSLTAPGSIRSEIKANWGKYSKKITSKDKIPFTTELDNFIDCVDFSIFSFISPDKFMDLLRVNKRLYYQYFGVRSSDIVRVKMEVPDKVVEKESTYITHLLNAYHEEDNSITSGNIGLSKYSTHFSRARETFWIAESLRKVSEDNSPGDNDEFAEFMHDMETHVADTYEEQYPCGLECNKAVIKDAKSYMPKAARVISGEISSGEKIGVCYHLSNNDRLIWVK